MEINPTAGGVDPKIMAESAGEMGEISQNANQGNADLIQDMQGIKAEALNQSANPPGSGENFDSST